MAISQGLFHRNRKAIIPDGHNGLIAVENVGFTLWDLGIHYTAVCLISSHINNFNSSKFDFVTFMRISIANWTVCDTMPKKFIIT